MSIDKPQKSILVIEDDHDTRVSLRQNLETQGFFVFSATNGRTGLEMLKRIKPPCLILLDVVMPFMNGEQFIEAMESDPELHMIPVIIVSAFPDKAKGIIAKTFLQKPIELRELIDAVKKCCPG